MRVKFRVVASIKWLFVVLWMIAIFMLSNEVASISSGRSAVIVNAITSSLHVSLSESALTFLTRKAAHIFMYFVLGILIYNVIKDYGLPAKRAILISIVLALGYATTDEIHQLFVPGRSAEVQDVAIDTTASALGVSLYYYTSKLQQKRSRVSLPQSS